MKLSQHFSLSELTKSSTAARKGIDNTPSEAEIGSLIMLCNEILEPVRFQYGVPFIPSSGFRCLALNREINSADNSQHVTACAVDFEVPGIDNKDVAVWVMENCDFDQLILEFYKEGEPTSGWVHCSIPAEGVPGRSTARIFDGKSWTDLA